MPNEPPRTCPECGVELAEGAAPGQCPNCLLGLGLGLAAPEAEVGDQRAQGGGRKAELGNQPDAEAHSLPPRPSLSATPFGDYELLEEIGRGGMGLVYKARQRSLDRIVALKVLLFGPHAPPESVKRFRAEAVARAALQHPNIVAIHEVGVHQGQHFLVMDFVEGRSLARVISDFGFRISDFRKAAGYVKTIAEAIHYAHEHGLLHRDLKPSNVLIDAQDQPRVTDFGLARRLEGDSELTVSGQVLGSPNYMPPEQATGKRATVSRRSDVYALGAMLYHAVTGRPPFVGEGLADTVQQVLNVEPVSPRALNPRLPVDLETICLKCLEKEPAKRYATGQMLAEELGRFLEGKPVLARPVGPAGKAWRWCRRNPRLAVATGAAFLSMGLGLAGVTWQWRQAAAQQTRAEAGELLARRNAYAADMNLVQRALEDSDLASARRLLDRYRPARNSEVRGPKSEVDLRAWEWRYLWARCQSDERFTLCRYSNAVSALAFSVDGKWLAVRHEGGRVAVWDAVAKQPLSELSGAGWYKALAFSPQGSLLAWGSEDASGAPVVSLWDVRAQRECARLRLSDELVSVAFSPDAQALATLDYDGTVHVWDVAKQQVLTKFPTAPVNVWSNRLSRGSRSKVFTDHYGSVVFSPNGRWLAVGEATNRIQLLERATGKRTEIRVPAAADGIAALAFAPDSRLLAAGFGAGDNDVHVWNVETGADAPLAGHSGWIAGLAFSPDGQMLASVSADQTLYLWDVARKVKPRCFRGNTNEVWAVAWSPDGKELVTGAKDGSVRYWDPAAKFPASYAVVPGTHTMYGLAFLPDSQTLLTVNRPEGAVMRWDTAAVQNPEPLAYLGSHHLSLDLSRDGRWLALGDMSGNIQVWDFPGQRLVTNLVFPGTKIFGLMFSPAGNYLNCGAFDPDFRIVLKFWSVTGWREIDLPGLHAKRVVEPAFSSNERTVAIGYGDGTASWWDLKSGVRQSPLFMGESGLVHVAFSPDRRWFGTGGMNGRVTLWDTITRQARSIEHGHRSEMQDLAFSPDSRRLISSGTNPGDLIKFWDVETGRDVATLPGEPFWCAHVGFSPDGSTLFAASMEGKVLLWRAPSWEEIEAAEKKPRTP